MSNDKGHFSPTDQDNWTDKSGPTSKVVPNMLVGPNQNGLFHFDSGNSGIFIGNGMISSDILHKYHE